jgi:hypothetical protein
MAISKNARCQQCGGGDLAYSEAGGIYDSRCIACGFREAGTVSYPVPVAEFAQACLLVRCSSPAPTASELNALRRIFPELAEEGLHLLRARLAASAFLTLGPFGFRHAAALKAEAEATGLIVHTEASEGPS